MFPRNENQNGSTFGCSPGTRTGPRVRSHVPPERKPERKPEHSPKPPFYETALLSRSEQTTANLALFVPFSLYLLDPLEGPCLFFATVLAIDCRGQCGFLFIHRLFPQQEGSCGPFTYSLGNHGRTLHSFTPIHALNHANMGH